MDLLPGTDDGRLRTRRGFDNRFFSDALRPHLGASFHPPDTASAIFWLKNRRRDLWRDAPAVVVNNQNNQLAVTNGDPVGTMQDYRRIVDSSDEL